MMKTINTIYDKDRLVLPQNGRLRDSRFSISIELPEEELLVPVEVSRVTPHAKAGSLQEKLNLLLGPAAMERVGVNKEQDSEALMAIMEEQQKYNELNSYGI